VIQFFRFLKILVQVVHGSHAVVDRLFLLQPFVFVLQLRNLVQIGVHLDVFLPNYFLEGVDSGFVEIRIHEFLERVMRKDLGT